MKYLTMIILLVSCGTASTGIDKHDLDLIELKISFVRDRAAMQYKIDSTDRATALFRQYFSHPNRDPIIQLEMMNFRDDWNKPYQITRDSTLTADKFIRWCRANGFDPVTKIDYLP